MIGEVGTFFFYINVCCSVLVLVTIWRPFWIRLFIKSVIHDNSIWSRSIIVIMDVFLILTQFSYKICIQEKERSLHVITKFNRTINMAAFGHISDTEVIFLEIWAMIVIEVKNIFCELSFTFFHTCRYLPDNISHISRVILIIDLYTRAQKEYSSTNSKSPHAYYTKLPKNNCSIIGYWWGRDTYQMKVLYNK